MGIMHVANAPVIIVNPHHSSGKVDTFLHRVNREDCSSVVVDVELVLVVNGATVAFCSPASTVVQKDEEDSWSAMFW